MMHIYVMFNQCSLREKHLFIYYSYSMETKREMAIWDNHIILFLANSLHENYFLSGLIQVKSNSWWMNLYLKNDGLLCSMMQKECLECQNFWEISIRAHLSKLFAFEKLLVAEIPLKKFSSMMLELVSNQFDPIVFES